MKINYTKIIFLILLFQYAHTLAIDKQAKTIAILPFENLTGINDYNWIGFGFSETISAGLFQVGGLTLVERGKLNAIINEIKLGLSGLIDEGTAQKAGQLIGANYITLGSYQVLNDNIRVACRIIEVSSGKILTGLSVTNVYTNIFNVQDSIIAFLISELCDIEIIEDNLPKAIDLETENIKAYELAIRGNMELDDSKYASAANYFEDALKLDQNYERARDGLNFAYWPMAPGNEWLYDTETVSNGKTISKLILKRKIIGTEIINGNSCVIEETKPVDENKYSMFGMKLGTKLFLFYNDSGMGLYKVEHALGSEILPDGSQYMKLPFCKGDKWSSSMPTMGKMVKVNYEVLSEEEIIELKIGTYNCIKLVATSEILEPFPTKMSVCYWLNKGIGMIKNETISSVNINGKEVVTESTSELVKYKLNNVVYNYLQKK